MRFNNILSLLIEAKLISQYGKNFRGCLHPLKAIIGSKAEDQKDFRVVMQKKEKPEK